MARMLCLTESKWYAFQLVNLDKMKAQFPIADFQHGLGTCAHKQKKRKEKKKTMGLVFMSFSLWTTT